MKWAISVASGLLAAFLLFSATNLFQSKKKSDQAEQQIDQTRQIALARMDLQIAQAREDAAEAEAILNHQAHKPTVCGLSSEDIAEEIELLQAATANYKKKTNRLNFLVRERQKIGNQK